LRSRSTTAATCSVRLNRSYRSEDVIGAHIWKHATGGHHLDAFGLRATLTALETRTDCCKPGASSKLLTSSRSVFSSICSRRISFCTSSTEASACETTEFSSAHCPFGLLANVPQACPTQSRAEHRQLAASDWQPPRYAHAFHSHLCATRALLIMRADCDPASMLDHSLEPAPARRSHTFTATCHPPPPAQQLQRALNPTALARERARLLAGTTRKAPCIAWLCCCTTYVYDYTTIKDHDYVLASCSLMYPLKTVLLRDTPRFTHRYAPQRPAPAC
jgi:hypothetical protein